MNKEKIEEYLIDINYLLTIPENMPDDYYEIVEAIHKDVEIIRKELEKE